MTFDAQVKEVINRNLLVSELLAHDFNAYLPVYDRGVDLIAFHEKRGVTLPIQLKGRWNIMEKYRGRGIWIAFPERRSWYLAPHDTMISMGEQLGYCESLSWSKGRAYSCPSMGKKLTELMEPWILASALSTPFES
ncbi:MAG TPA: hypothetical protein VFK50_08410 [Sphingomicrobium sp.]|nr:hypothetical protein [Sphingomicrobium sp.]